MHRAGFAALATAVLLIAATAPAEAAWEVTQGKGVCSAAGPSDRGAQLSVVTFGPQTFLLISADNFPQASGSYEVTLSFDGAAPWTVKAEGHDHTYGVPLTPTLYTALHDSTRVDVSNGQGHYGFALGGVVKAVDEVLSCVGLDSYAAMRSHVPQPIPGTDWKISDPMAGTNDCGVRRNGESIDTTLSLTKKNTVLLAAGRADWAMPPAMIEATLAIGDAAPATVKAGVLTNVVIVNLDAAQLAALTTAKSLKWTFSWGSLDADVTGADKAIEALRACEVKRRTTP
jgi:hypothetical protein